MQKLNIALFVLVAGVSSAYFAAAKPAAKPYRSVMTNIPAGTTVTVDKKLLAGGVPPICPPFCPAKPTQTDAPAPVVSAPKPAVRN